MTPESCCLRLSPLFGFDQTLLHQAAVKLLDVRVHTLPVRLLHPDQVFSIQQRRAACQPPGDRMSIKTTWDNWWLRKSVKKHKKPLCLTKSCSLCRAERQLEVVSGLVGVEDGVLEGVGEESVHQGAEGDAIFPTGGEVLNVYPLFEKQSLKSSGMGDRAACAIWIDNKSQTKLAADIFFTSYGSVLALHQSRSICLTFLTLGASAEEHFWGEAAAGPAL